MFSRHVSTGALAVVLVAATGAGQQGSFTSYGFGCPGGSGQPLTQSYSVPATAVGPNIGEQFSLMLANAPGGTLSALMIGSAIPPLALGPCELLVNPIVTVPQITSGAGTAATPILLPYDLELFAAQFSSQWLALDSLAPLGLTLSNGLTGVIGANPLVLSSASTSSAREGELFTIVGRNFGNDPAELLVHIVGPIGRGLAHVHSASSSGATSQAVVELLSGAGTGLFRTGRLTVARGRGFAPQLPTIRGFNPPRLAHTWIGQPGLPGTSVAGPSIITSSLPGQYVVVPFQIENGAVVFDLPVAPCGGAAWPAGTEIDVYVDWTTHGCTNPVHDDYDIDFYAWGLTLLQNKTCPEVAQQIRAILDAGINPNPVLPLVSVTVEAGCKIRLWMSECSGKDPGGFIRIRCP